MSLQYLETLKKPGESQGTTFIMPIEFTSLLQSLMRHTTESGNGGDGNN
jgi:hypothetical protein